MKQLRVIAEREPYFGDGVALAARIKIDGVATYAQPLEFAPRNECASTEPFLRLDYTAAQELIDSLWQCGLRPTEAAGSAGSLRATERHLEDMRRLVFSDKP